MTESPLQIPKGKDTDFMSLEASPGIWKNAAMFLSGVVLTLMMMWGTYVRTAVSREEMEKYVNDRQNGTEQQLQNMNQNLIDLKAAVERLKVLQESEDKLRTGKRGR